MKFLPVIHVRPFHVRYFKSHKLEVIEREAIDEYFWNYFGKDLDEKIIKNETDYIHAAMSFSHIESELEVALCVYPKDKDKVSQDDVKQFVAKIMDTLDEAITFGDEDYRDDERFKEIFNRLKSESNIKEEMNKHDLF